MNHKRGKAKNQRAGCLMCKPNKINGINKDLLGHTGFGKLRDLAHAKEDAKREMLGTESEYYELDDVGNK